MIRTLPARSLSYGDPRVRIAVIDGPVDLSHPCFCGARLSQLQTLVAPDAGRGAAVRHGTHVASVIFGQLGSEVEGVAPGCHGLLIPVFAADARGDLLPCSQLDLARAPSRRLSSIEQT
jgi:subtilisin family serine protease